MRRAKRQRFGLAAAAFALALCGFAGAAAAESECTDSRCAEFRPVPPPKSRWHGRRRQACCCEAPPGWGWYRRQKLCHDCSQPLVVIDELGGAVAVHQNW